MENQPDMEKRHAAELTQTSTEVRARSQRAEDTGQAAARAQTRAPLRTVSAEAPLVVSVVVSGGGAPKPRPALQNTLLVALSIEYEGEHTGVTFLSFWKKEERLCNPDYQHNPGRACPAGHVT